MNNLILCLLVPSCSGFCEAYWRSNISSAYGSSYNLSEPGNAYSSLTYTIFGFIGLSLKNYTNLYYFLMNLFIINGFTSFFHHYYYSNADWAYRADLITMTTLTSISLLYIVCDNEYFRFTIINRLCNLVCTINCISLLVWEGIEGWVLLKINMGALILSQIIICLYFFYIKSDIKYLILLSSIWNGILFSLGVIFWHIDVSCNKWLIQNRFNGHVLWHITVAWSLFNIISITNICRYNYNNIKFKWKPLFTCIPWFFYIILLSKNKSNIRNNYTCINLEEIKLVGNAKNHRRIRTFG